MTAFLEPKTETSVHFNHITNMYYVPTLCQALH